jgi:lipopolysaccharide export system protein LptA
MRCSEKNDLDRVWCEGSVHVHQEPAAPEDKGVDIRGDTLHVKHFVEGNIMDVTGNLAQVQLDKMTILGPAVTIDQRDNLAKVFGIGAMQMLSKSSLQGEALAEPTELTIHWNKSMLFDGKWARFFGGVQALQKDSMMLCQDLQAVLDRPVSFKEGGKGGQSASVQELVCDKNVRIDDIQYEGKQFLRRTRLFAPEVQVNKEESIVNAAGPGQVNILQFGTADDNPPGGAPAQQTAAAPKPAAPAKKEEKELTLTRVNFGQKLYANNKSKLAIFWGSVDVVHVPTDDIDLKVDVNRPPPGCVHMVCERLEVRTITLPDGRTTQQMEAHKRAVVDSAEFWGQADVVKYDQSKELMILEGGEGGMAKLYRVKVPAGKQERMTGKKIWYYRKTNEATIQGGDSLDIRVN